MEIASSYTKANALTQQASPDISLSGDASVAGAKTKPTPMAGAEPSGLTQMLTDTLQLHGYKPTPENLQLLTQMLEAGIPVTKENIAQLHQAFKVTQNIDQALFIFQNNISATPKNASLLNALAGGQIKIAAQITSLIDAVAQLQDSSLQSNLVKILSHLSKPAAGMDGAAPPQAQAEPANASAPIKIYAMAKTFSLAEGSPVPQTPQTTLTPAASIPPMGIPRHLISNSNQLPPAPQTAPQQMIPAETSASRAYAAFQAVPPSGPAQAAQNQTRTPQSAPQAQALPQTPAAVQMPLPEAPNIQPLPTMPAGETRDMQAVPMVSESSEISSLRNSLSVPLQNSSVPDLENFINTLREALHEARAQAQLAAANNPGDQGTLRVLRDIQALTEYIDFASQIRNQIFIQVPMVINDQTLNTALYVKKETAFTKKNKDGGTALIALDTAFLGHFEAYVQKEGQAVRCQFRLESGDIENLVRANIHRLDSLLKDHRYILESFTFLIGDRAFTVLDALEEKKSISRSDAVFDARA